MVGLLVCALLVTGCSVGAGSAVTSNAAGTPAMGNAADKAARDARAKAMLHDSFQMGLEFGERLKAAHVDDMTVVMAVNGEPVTRSELARTRVFLEIKDEVAGIAAPTDQEVRDRVTWLAAMRAEARRRGLYPSDDEVTQQDIAPMQRLIASGGGDTSQLDGMVKGLGLTQDEYWRQPWVIDEQRQGMILERLIPAVWPLLRPAPGETAAQALQRWWDTLVATAVVKVMPSSAVGQ